MREVTRIDVHRVAERFAHIGDVPVLQKFLRKGGRRRGREVERHVDPATGAGVGGLIAAILVRAHLEDGELDGVALGIGGRHRRGGNGRRGLGAEWQRE